MDDRTVVQEYLDMLAKGDLERVGELIAEDAVFHIPGSNRVSGDKVGREQIVGMFRTLLDQMPGSGFETEVHDLLASDKHVVALVRRQIAGVDAAAAVIYHLRDGLIAETWVHEGDQQALDAAIGS